MKKIAVILFNLGGPDTEAAIKPFLKNLFSDRAIIQLPFPFRQLLASFIAARRWEKARAIYCKIGGGSPILPNTLAQAKALEAALSSDGQIKCFVAMRYWRPFAGDVVLDVLKYAPDHIVLLPLYPQFSTTTTGSSLGSWREAAKAAQLNAPTSTICCYPQDSGFISALIKEIVPRYEAAKNFGSPRLLFSAHGLPEKIIKSGDPYQSHCELTVAAIIERLAIPDLDFKLCYQSRVGPLTWIGPSTEDEIIRAGHDDVPVIIVPIAFVCENSETLFEIDMFYREMAVAQGVPFFDRTPTVGTDPEFIEGLAKRVRSILLDKKAERICMATLSCCRQAA